MPKRPTPRHTWGNDPLRRARTPHAGGWRQPCADQFGPGTAFCWTRAKFLETSSSLRPSNFREISGKSVTFFSPTDTRTTKWRSRRWTTARKAERRKPRLGPAPVPKQPVKAPKLPRAPPPFEGTGEGGSIAPSLTLMRVPIQSSVVCVSDVQAYTRSLS